MKMLRYSFVISSVVALMSVTAYGTANSADVDMNGNVDPSDIFLIAAQHGGSDLAFDIDGDGDVDWDDQVAGLAQIMITVNGVDGSPCLGDVNATGNIDTSDLGLMLNNAGATGFSVGVLGGDLNGDGTVDIGFMNPNTFTGTDGAIVQSHGGLGVTCVVPVPEPDCFFPGVLALLALLAAKRRSSTQTNSR